VSEYDGRYGTHFKLELGCLPRAGLPIGEDFKLELGCLPRAGLPIGEDFVKERVYTNDGRILYDPPQGDPLKRVHE